MLGETPEGGSRSQHGHIRTLALAIIVVIPYSSAVKNKQVKKAGERTMSNRHN
jgi:hypothetical protein